MRSLLVGILGSAVVAVIYGLLIAQREETIRTYLRTTTRGWYRRLYVMALIQAVRGQAAVADSRHVAVLILFVLLGTSIALWIHTATFEAKWASIGDRIRVASESLSTQSARPEDREKAREEIQRELDELTADRNAVEQRVTWYIRVQRALAIVLYVAFTAGWLFWLPYVLMRTRFAHEISRFSLRIQGLASSDELAKLTAIELAVRNRETLSQYVEIMKEVATRHGLGELTKTFELWEQREKGTL